MTRRRLSAQHRRGYEVGKPEPVRVWLLGGFRVSVGSRTVEGDRWRLRKAGSLIKLLALAPRHALHRAQLTDVLWPDLDSKSAANNLHRVLHFARRALEPDAPNTASRYLPLRGDMLALCPDGRPWVDAEAFENAAATARRVREPAAYRAAIELYAGELLPEDLYEPWTEEKREQLRRLYRSLRFELAALHEERGEHAPAMEILRQMAAEEPANEDAHAGLMRLLAHCGQHREAILQYERLREALREKLDEEPGAATRRLHEEIRSGKAPAASSPPAGRPPEEPADPSRHNLRASPTSFVGEEALVEVRRSLTMTRLLTLTGAGGSGKTRLALEVARDLVGAYPGGVWFVELAPLAEPALVARAVAAALDVREQPGRPITQTLSRSVGSRQMLLVFDNCEHLVDAAAHLAQSLLGACPKLRVVATSREPLGVPGETVWPVPTLSVPEEVDGASTVEGLIRSEAVRLFVDRARSRLPNFELRRENAPAVARVCRKLDGIPLAIELACARMGALAVEQVAQRLEGSLDLLSAGARTAEPRQRTLRATLDWSHGLLSGDEKALFRRLSMFAAGWELSAAGAVCSEDGRGGEVVDLLSRLVDKSLVAAEGGVEGATRYRMLEPVRQYGREQLEESREMEQARERHANHYLALAERVEPELSGTRPATWLERLEAERGNLRAALSWALDSDEAGQRAEIGLRLAAALGRFWDAHGPGEGRRWLEKGLARGGGSPASVRAKALNEAGFIAVYEGDPGAIELLEESPERGVHG